MMVVGSVKRGRLADRAREGRDMGVMGEAKPPSVWGPEMMIARVSLAEHPRAVSWFGTYTACRYRCFLPRALCWLSAPWNHPALESWLRAPSARRRQAHGDAARPHMAGTRQVFFTRLLHSRGVCRIAPPRSVAAAITAAGDLVSQTVWEGRELID